LRVHFTTSTDSLIQPSRQLPDATLDEVPTNVKTCSDNERQLILIVEWC